MVILRNSIEVMGIAEEGELPKQINGQLIEYSETDYIYVPENRPMIYNISKVEIELDIRESRTVEAPTGRIIILEGSRKFNITYKPIGYYDQSFTLKLDLPFNTFIDLPNNAGEVKDIEVFVVDAFFKLMNAKKIYSFIVYMVNVEYQRTDVDRAYKESTVKVKNLDQFSLQE